MRAISNRIPRLERTLVPPVLEEGESAADILRARRRRRLEAAGQPFVHEPRRNWTASACRNGEEKALGLTREVSNGQERVIWNPALSIPPREFEFVNAEVSRLKAALQTWDS
jgi:hypothetical protein